MQSANSYCTNLKDPGIFGGPEEAGANLDNMVLSPNGLGVLCRHVNRAASLQHPWTCVSRSQNMSTKQSDPNFRPTEALYESLPTFNTGMSDAPFVGG